MAEKYSPLMTAWTRYAVEVVKQSPLQLTDEMMAFMAGASHVVLMLADAADEGEDRDVSAVFDVLRADVAAFSEFMVEQREAVAREAAE